MYSLKNSSILHEASKSKHKANFAVQLLIFLAVFLVSGMVSSFIIGIPVGVSMTASIMQTIDPNDILNGTVDMTELTKQIMDMMPEWFSVATLFATVITTLAVLLYVRKMEGRSAGSMGLSGKGFARKYGLGYLIGIVMIAATLGLAVLLGGVELTGLNENIPWLYIALFFLGYIVQGMSEEFLCRGYLAVSLANKATVSVAVGVSSVAFAMLHLANPGIAPLAFINLVLFGVFMGVYMFRTDDLWGACAIHSAWNFVQGNVFGVSVSGGALQSSVFGTSFVEGRELISGGAFGFEGGLCVTAVLLVATALTLYLPMKPRPELPEDAEEPVTGHKEIPLYIQK